MTDKPKAAIGIEVIRQYLKHLPHRPGVYRMIDAKGQILYVGKARDLKNRVTNYTNLTGKGNRLSQMIISTASMEFVITENEAEALLLEANLIKKLQPRYNILLRDDKSFPYLLMTEHPFPRLQKFRGKQDKKGHYFGPFASAGDLNKTITQLQRAFLLRPCSDSMFESRSRPCLQYQIKRCSAPCVDYIDEAEYGALVKEASDFLRGNSRDLQKNINAQMQQASEALEFERAAILRNRLHALTQIQQGQKMQAAHIKEADVIAVATQGNQACIQVFFFRDGQNFGNLPFFPKITAQQTEAEILTAFLPQFYQSRPIPKQIMLNHLPDELTILEEAFAQLAGRKIEFLQPQRGDKKDVMQNVERNAKHALKRQSDAQMGNRQFMENLVKIFDLQETPERIEVYDNSHISGSHAIGAMIVATADGFTKNHYRKFNIKTAETDDDFAMMREVLKRRLSKLKETNVENSKILLLIDGGKGQFSAVKGVMEELNLWGEVPMVCISKGPDRNAGREKFHVEGKPEFQLPVNDPTLHYLQRLRDESHRFAIGTHRAKRSSAIKKSELDSIEGIGPSRKRALLQHFGSSRAVANASRDELSAVEGLNAKTAETIWRHFHG